MASSIVAFLTVAMFVLQMAWPSVERLTSAPASSWLGGICGSFYALVTIALLARRMGAATLMALIVAGQLIAPVAVDHFGVFGFEIRSATLLRIAGCALLISGFVLISRSYGSLQHYRSY